MVGGKPKTLKWRNRQVLLDFLRRSEEVSIAHISEEIGLSKPTVKKALEYYSDKGFVLPAGKGNSTEEGGKKPDLFTFNAQAGYVTAFHVFPDELYAAIFDLRLNMLQDVSIKNELDESVAVIANEVCEGIEKLLNSQNIDMTQLIGVAIGTHGITNYDQGIVYTAPHFPSWNENVPLRDILTEKSPCGHVPFYIDNQIRFQVFAERALGIAQNKKNIVVIEGGIGLVAGIIVKDEIKRGVHFLAGEIGHMILNPEGGEVCSCGGKGCFEAMVAVKRIVRMAQERRKEFPDSQIFRTRISKAVRIEDIFEASNTGDTLARSLMDEVIKWFAIGISNLVLMHDPEIIILQGIYAKAGEYFLQRLRKEVNQYALIKLHKDIEIRYSSFEKNRGVLGGAAYVISEYFNNSNIYTA